MSELEKVVIQIPSKRDHPYSNMTRGGKGLAVYLDYS